MDKQVVQRHLHATERHIVSGESIIARQMALIARLKRNGHDTTEAEGWLAELERIQDMHVAHRERLMEELNR